MYESFGATVSGNAVDIRLFFPDVAKDPGQYENGGLPGIGRLQVAGDFQGALGGQDWDPAGAPAMTLEDHPQGILYHLRIPHLPDGFYQYKYVATYPDGEIRWCGDPCTKYVGIHENAGFVVGGLSMVSAPLAHPLPFHDLVIYELMIDDFTHGYRGAQTPVDAVRARLDHLQALGINAVEFMPWTAWRGHDFSWGYNPYLFFAVEDRYIRHPDEPLERLYRVKQLFDEIHQRGMHVIMDGVFNHVDAGGSAGTGFAYHWLYRNPEDSPFTGGFANAGYFEDLDYNNGCTRQFILDVCTYWLERFGVDGIRFDYTLGFYRPGEDEGIEGLIADLRAWLAARGRTKVPLMLEHLSDNRYEAIDVANRVGASGCWYDRFLYDVPQQAAAGHIGTDLMRVLDSNRDFALGHGPVTYIENHDHSTVVNRVGGRGLWWKVQPALIALLTCPGAVLIHNGQEFGDDRHVPDSGDDRVRSRPVNWHHADDATGRHLLWLHRHLIGLRREHPALRSVDFYPRDYADRDTRFNPQGYGVDLHRDLVIYHRWGEAADGDLERFIVALNFSGYDQWVDVPFPANGVWQEVLEGGEVQVDDYRLRGHRIPSHWGRVFYRKG